ncbi:MAG: NUDIX hydrolase [Candidatus Nanoarchaeia archaeon]|nr:NUDIX hydrolase [Candidatus Nanoarchaeia archaeon]
MKFKCDWDNKEYELPKGKTFSWRPSAYAFVVWNNKILLTKSQLHGKWELPGGGIELGETVEGGLKREVLEESGYEIEKISKNPIYFENNFFYGPDIDKYFETLLMVFQASLKNLNQKKELVDFKNDIIEIKLVDIKDLEKYELIRWTKNALQKLMGDK